MTEPVDRQPGRRSSFTPPKGNISAQAKKMVTLWWRNLENALITLKEDGLITDQTTVKEIEQLCKVGELSGRYKNEEGGRWKKGGK